MFSSRRSLTARLASLVQQRPSFSSRRSSLSPTHHKEIIAFLRVVQPDGYDFEGKYEFLQSYPHSRGENVEFTFKVPVYTTTLPSKYDNLDEPIFDLGEQYSVEFGSWDKNKNRPLNFDHNALGKFAMKLVISGAKKLGFDYVDAEDYEVGRLESDGYSGHYMAFVTIRAIIDIPS